jgi:hypothetical protein
MYTNDESAANSNTQSAGQLEASTTSPDQNSATGGSTSGNHPFLQLIQSLQSGFNVPTLSNQQASQAQAPTSLLSNDPAIAYAQMVELEGAEGSIIYYPPEVPDLDVGDVLYLREKETPQAENGLIVQVIEKGTVAYPQAETKALFRLMASVRAHQLQRSHNEPTETIDQFLALLFKVRASIIQGTWSAPQGRVVTRNVDIFHISPQILVQNIIVTI